MSSPSSLLQVLTRFARTLADGYDVAEVLYDLSDSVVSVLGAKGAGVSLGGTDDKLVFVTATSDVITQVERVQQDSQEGPCHVAFMTNEVVVVEDISTHEDWPTLRDAAVSNGLTSVIGVPLRVPGQLDRLAERLRQRTEDLESRRTRGPRPSWPTSPPATSPTPRSSTGSSASTSSCRPR